LWTLLKRAAPPLAGLGAAPYLALAALLIASLAIYVLLRKKAADQFIAAGAALALAPMVLVSPHYPWYFAWIVPFLCFTPWLSVLYLTVASPLLYFVPGGPDPEGARTAYEAAIYGPFAALAGLELWRRHAARADATWTKVQA